MNLEDLRIYLDRCKPLKRGKFESVTVDITIGDGEDRQTFCIDSIEQEPDGTIYIRGY